MAVTDTIGGAEYQREAPIPCPGCGAMNAGRVLPVKYGMKAAVVECGCGLAYQSPRPSDAASQAYMDMRWGSGDRYVADADAQRGRGRRQVAIVGALCSPPGRLLDFGAGAGGFVEEATSRAGWDAIGVERSEAARANAAERGVTLLADLPPRGGFDVVTLWDVVEHLRDPVAVVTDLARLLRPGGVMFFETGNWDSWRRQVAGDRWGLFLFDHHFYFSPSSLERLLAPAGLTGWRVLDVGAERPRAKVAVKHPRLAMRQWRAYLTGGPWSAYNVMTVVARRP